jgi:alkyl sulfatase BDS1-like metallo-beta-lactamase superfamily hydrolase
MTEDTAPKPASQSVAAAQAAVWAALPFEDTRDFEDARRGFVGTLPDAHITNASGRVVWSLKPYAFLETEDAPATVNPSLWRQARLNMSHGLFQVVDGLYQVRGLDIANMTIVEGATGLVVIDTLTSVEGARAALDLYARHRGKRPVRAVIYTHTHTDHWGGVAGVVEEADVKAGRVAVIAPDKFMEHAVSENIIAGTPMLRRAHYQFGPFVPKGPRGQVDAGLGKVTSRGTITLIPPTQVIREPVEVHQIDGVEMVFQLTPDTEAPAEMHMFYPGLKALNLAENATHNLHNIYPIRGAQVRDANAWAKYLNEARDTFALHADVVFAQHHWPVWGNSRVLDYMAKQRDTYKYLHDQTLRLMNRGLKAAEISEQLVLPKSLEREWHLRGYYGTFSHNAKAVYQRYLGWYDANPANLNPLPPVERAKKTVAYMGGAAAAIARAREDFAEGEYRWVADAMSQVVFAEPDNTAARHLGADALEQLGYQSESATWRNAYLQGSRELRGAFSPPPAPSRAGADIVRGLTLDLFFDFLGVRLNGPKAEGKVAVINWAFPDTGQRYALTLQNSAVTYLADRHAADTDCTVTLDRATLNRVILRELTLPDAVAQGLVKIVGNGMKLTELFALLDDFSMGFEIVEPLRAASSRKRGESQTPTR